MKQTREKRNLKEQRAITLIALVITIIVLLILAAVSIATLTGQNGILAQTNKAKEQTKKANIEEQRKLAQAEANLNITETVYNGVKIPANCAPIKISGGSTVNEGLVIIDKNGNEWVWIEVPKSIYTNATYNGGTAPASSEDYEKIESVMQEYANTYRSSIYTDTWYSEEQHGFASEEEYNNHKNNMLKSVYENGGFYIGRYEVGTSTARVKGTNDEGLSAPVIRQDAYPYNYVTCKQAQSLANQLATEGKTSSLMFGIQWDLVLKYIEEKGYLVDGTKVTQDMLKSDSTTWGNYYDAEFDITRGQYMIVEPYVENSWESVTSTYSKTKQYVLLTTGVTERNSVLNIYDLAGNVWEWTLEYTDETAFTCGGRGGNYDQYGDWHPASYHGNFSEAMGYRSVGFRPALY